MKSLLMLICIVLIGCKEATEEPFLIIHSDIHWDHSVESQDDLPWIMFKHGRIHTNNAGSSITNWDYRHSPTVHHKGEKE